MELDRNLVQKALVMAAGSAALGVAVALLQAGPALAPLRNISSTSSSSGSVAAPQVAGEPATDSSAQAFLAPAIESDVPRAEAAPVLLPPDVSAAAPAPVVAAARVPPNADEMVQQLAAAERLLRMGHITAVLDFGDQVQSSTDLSFELTDEHDASMLPRLRALVTYVGPDGPHQIEHVIVGDQSWQRQRDGQWVRESDQETVAQQVQVYLPHADQARDAVSGEPGQQGLLHWFDPVRDGVVHVEFDPQAGVPQRLRWATTDGGPTLNVTYGGWNDPVSIPDPAAEGMPGE
jgi:hypothetical protein